MIPVEPMEWYYQFMDITPLWDDPRHGLVFNIDLPLVRPIPYLNYHITTYPVPYVKTSTTVEILAAGNYGLDTKVEICLCLLIVLESHHKCATPGHSTRQVI